MVTVTQVVELAFAAVAVIGILGIILTKLNQGKSITGRSIQGITLVLVLPSSAILLLEGVLSANAVVAPFGVIIGYVLSGFEVQ